MRVGLIGTGAMGEPIGRRLLEAGHSVRVFNRTAARAADLVGAGAEPAETPSAAATERDIVITMLSDADAVRHVVTRADGAARALGPGAVLVDMSTTGPSFALELRGLVPSGAHVVDAPVMGSRAEAAAGRLRIFVGGAPDAVERCRPVLDSLGSVDVVGSAGAGAAAKLVANLALLGTMTLLAEVVELAQALDLELVTCLRVLDATPLAAQAERRREALHGRQGPTRFALDLAAKDARLAGAEAVAAKVDTPVAAAVVARLDAAVAAGLASADYTAMLTHR